MRRAASITRLIGVCRTSGEPGAGELSRQTSAETVVAPHRDVPGTSQEWNIMGYTSYMYYGTRIVSLSLVPTWYTIIESYEYIVTELSALIRSITVHIYTSTYSAC